MGKFFNDRTDVLYQNPSHPKEYIRGGYKSRWVLVPMCAFKVMVPYPKSTDLNLFQETILRLFMSGAKENVWLADMLALNQDLVEYIVEELITRELITPRRTVTKKGKELLGDKDGSYDLKTGYIFYNYVTRTFADTFVADKDFNIVNVKRRSGDNVTFYIDESVANPKVKTAVIIHAENEESKFEPTPYDILRICRRHKRRTQQLIKKDLEDGEYEKDIKGIEKVSLLGEKKYVYVPTYFFLPTDDLMNRSKIQICYPFGDGISTNLFEEVKRLSKNEHNTSLKEAIKELQTETFSMTEKELEHAKQVNKEVDRMIKDVLSTKIEDYPYVHHTLIKMEDNYRQIKTLLAKNKGNNRELLKQKVSDYIVQNYNLMAGILMDVASANDYFNIDRLTTYPNQNAEILSAIAKKCGFIDNEENFTRSLAIKKGAVKAAYSSSSVKALLAYNLLIAADYNEHPFYKLAQYVPQFITYVDKLTTLRNDNDHGNNNEYNFDTLEAYSIKNMYIASILLDGLTFNKDNRKIDFESELLFDTGRLKVAKQAENYIENEFTPNIYKYKGVLNKVIAVQKEMEYEGESYPGRVSEVYEAIMKILCGKRIISEALVGLKDFRDENAKQNYLQLLKDKGFEVDELVYYTLSKLSNTFRNYHKGTLSTLFYTWFFSECKQEDSMLDMVTKKVPQLVKIFKDVIEQRKHQGKCNYNDKKLDYMKENFKPTVNALIDIMSEWDIG